MLRLTDNRRENFRPLAGGRVVSSEEPCNSQLPSAPTAGWAQLDSSYQKVFLQHSAKIFLSPLILQRVIYDSASDQLSYNLSRKASAGVNQCLFPTHEMAKSLVTGWLGMSSEAGLAGVRQCRDTTASPACGGEFPQGPEKYFFSEGKKVINVGCRRQNQPADRDGTWVRQGYQPRSRGLPSSSPGKEESTDNGWQGKGTGKTTSGTTRTPWTGPPAVLVPAEQLWAHSCYTAPGVRAQPQTAASVSKCRTGTWLTPQQKRSRA